MVRALDQEGIDAADVHRREPTLDDVFLTLTGTKRVEPTRPMSTTSRRWQPDARDTITVNSGIHTRLRWFVSDTLAVARRSLAHIRQIPEKLLDVTRSR